MEASLSVILGDVENTDRVFVVSVFSSLKALSFVLPCGNNCSL